MTARLTILFVMLGGASLALFVASMIVMRLATQQTDSVLLLAKAYEDVAEEYRVAMKAQLQINEAAHDSIQRLLPQGQSEEWELLQILCGVLERSGTEFEPGSALQKWWAVNKGW